MLKKTITFEDYDGNKRTEDHYFHLNKAEVIKWLSTSGDYTLDKVFIRLSEEKNGKKIMEIFEDIIARSYGRKSLDGRRFEKSEELTKEFMETEAYSTLFMELASNAEAAAEFIKGILPKDLADEISKVVNENADGIPAAMKDYVVTKN